MNQPHRCFYCCSSVLALYRTYEEPCFLMFHILVIVYPRSLIFLYHFFISSFTVAWMYLRTTLKGKLLYSFGLYVYNSIFLLFNSFIMFMYAMELFGWILICSFMIFISYSEATFFSCYDNDKK